MSPEWFVCLIPVALSLFLWRECSRKLAARVLCVSLPLVIFLIVGYRYGALSEAETEKQFQIEQVVYATLQSGGSASTAEHDVCLLSGFSNGAMRVSESTFRQLEAAWGSAETEGGVEVVSWPGTLPTVKFMAVPILFRNTLMQTRAGGALKPVDDELVAGYGLHPYPEFKNPISFEMILGSGGSPFPRREEAEFKLKVLNATAGDEKHFQAWILLFPGQPAEAADFQRRLWKGGKPNDFVVCLGVNASNQIMWSRAFSWSPDRTPVKEFENWALPGKTIDLVETVGEIESVLSKWKPTQLPTTMLEMDLKLESFPMLIMVTIIMCLLLAFGLVDDDGSE